MSEDINPLTASVGCGEKSGKARHVAGEVDQKARKKRPRKDMKGDVDRQFKRTWGEGGTVKIDNMLAAGRA